eukprot:6073482-Pleurochrysis_carterae.AAC.1
MCILQSSNVKRNRAEDFKYCRHPETRARGRAQAAGSRDTKAVLLQLVAPGWLSVRLATRKFRAPLAGSTGRHP